MSPPAPNLGLRPPGWLCDRPREAARGTPAGARAVKKGSPARAGPSAGAPLGGRVEPGRPRGRQQPRHVGPAALRLAGLEAGTHGLVRPQGVAVHRKLGCPCTPRWAALSRRVRAEEAELRLETAGGWPQPAPQRRSRSEGVLGGQPSQPGRPVENSKRQVARQSHLRNQTLSPV